MLTPDMDLYQDADGRSLNDTVNAYYGIVRSVQQVVEQNTLLGELRGDLVKTTQFTTDSIADIANFSDLPDGANGLLNRAAYYYIINMCNFYLRDVQVEQQKFNKYYMRKETAQVIMIRAWAYMQLVQNYGSVPFFTKPLSDASTDWIASAPKVDADNLLNYLLEEGDLMKAHDWEKEEGLPAYGSVQTGASSFPAALLIFPSKLILAELYLLRGHGQSDYEAAAQYYYDYLSNVKENAGSNPRVFSQISATKGRFSRSGVDHYICDVNAWAGRLNAVGSAGGEMVTAIPSASNSSFGLTLTRIPEIYGFKISSSSSTNLEEGGDVEDATTSGSISISPDYRLRQIAPSEKYLQLNAAQDYAYPDREDPNLLSFPEEGKGDARLNGSCPEVITDEGRLRFIQKFGIGNVTNEGQGSRFAFRYAVPIYRLTHIYLHFAEAINRAGFPHYAFAVLRDGLSSNSIPDTLRTVYDTTRIDTAARIMYATYVTDSIEDGANYITPEELKRAKDKPWLNFANANLGNIGIHQLGCGPTPDENIAFTYDTIVAQRIIDEGLRTGSVSAARRYARRLLDEEEEAEVGPSYDQSKYDVDSRPFMIYPQRVVMGSMGQDSIVTDTIALTVLIERPEAVDADYLAAQQNAVETLIADEAALETAFEGFRFYDLMRMARHKNQGDANLPANYGTQWLAWLIGRREADVAPYEEPANTSLLNMSLYNKLLDQQNWYLKSPQY